MHYISKFIMVAAAVLLNSAPSNAGEIVLNAVGDVMLAGSGAPTFRKKGYDYPFAAAATELRRGDIAVCNLEAPISKGGREFKGKKFRFRSLPQTAPALMNAGFRVVTLANNHMMDFGASALEATRRHLSRSGIAFCGAGDNLAEAREAAIITAQGKKVAFLSYSLTFPDKFYATANRPGTAPGFAGYFMEDIADAKKSADYVVVSFHWGTESRSHPNQYQINAAHLAVDAGADVVIGHHPHVLQGIERYKNGVIFYSLGNFAFGSGSSSAERSVIARIFLDNGVKGVELIPLNVLNREVRFQPCPLQGIQGQRVIDHINRISRKWNTIVSASAGRFMIERKQGKLIAGR